MVDRACFMVDRESKIGTKSLQTAKNLQKKCCKYRKCAYLCTVDSATQREIGSVRGLRKSSEEKGEDSSSCGFSPFLFLFICMIQDKCCIIRNNETGLYEFYENWNEIAERLCVSRQFVYKCRDSGLECRGYAITKKMKNRVYLVKKKGGKATLCYINTKKRFLTEIATGDMFPFRLVEDIKDLTYHYMNEKSLMEEFVQL